MSSSDCMTRQDFVVEKKLDRIRSSSRKSLVVRMIIVTSHIAFVYALKILTALLSVGIIICFRHYLKLRIDGC